MRKRAETGTILMVLAHTPKWVELPFIKWVKAKEAAAWQTGVGMETTSLWDHHEQTFSPRRNMVSKEPYTLR